MLMNIDRDSSVPIVNQIVLDVENRIRTGGLLPDDKLPSIRTVSKKLGISLMTVVNAYDKLSKNGLVYKIHGKGVFVRDIKQKYYISKKNNKLSEVKETWQDEVQDYVVRTGYLQRTALDKNLAGYNLGTAALHHRFLPTKDILNIAYKKLHKDAEILGDYPPVEGNLKLIAKVKGFLENKGIIAHEEEIIISSGSQLGIHLVAETFIGPGDVVVVEAPTFPGAIDVFKSRGAKIIEVPIDSDGIKPEALLDICERNSVKLLYTMPTFQNPTGIVMSLSVSQEILELASEYNFLILEDDSWSELSFEKIERPLKTLDNDNRVIYIEGFSKLFGPAYRVSAIVTNSIFWNKLVAAKSNIDSGTPLISQLMLEPYLGSLNQKQHLIKIRHDLKALRDRVVKHLDNIMPSYVKMTPPKGGLVMWLTFPRDFDTKMLYYKALVEENITFLLGDNCYSSLRGESQIRICFTYLTEERVMVSLSKLMELVKEVKNQFASGIKEPII